MKAVYHYAPWAYLPSMVEAGCLRPSNAGAEGETALLWFSAHQRWEPTATKLLMRRDGASRLMTFTEQLASFGCIRFGLAADDPRLMPWKAACAVAGTVRDKRRALERHGKKLGADPAHWFAVADPVPLAGLALEVFGDGAWRTAIPEEMAQVWIEHMAQRAA